MQTYLSDLEDVTSFNFALQNNTKLVLPCLSSIKVTDWSKVEIIVVRFMRVSILPHNFSSSLKFYASVPHHTAVMSCWSRHQPPKLLLYCIAQRYAGVTSCLCVETSNPNGKCLPGPVSFQIYRQPCMSSAGRLYRETSSWILPPACSET